MRHKIRYGVVHTILGLMVFACVSGGSSRPSLEEFLPKIEPNSFQFFHGSWIWPDAYYSFHITDSKLHVVHSQGIGIYQTHKTVDECPEIRQVFYELLDSVAVTTGIAVRRIEVPKQHEVVVDGPSYRLVYWSRETSSTIEIRGGENSRQFAPWLDAAFKVRRVGESCDGA